MPLPFDLPQLRDDLVSPKSPLRHFPSPFQANILTSPGSEKAGQVTP